MSFTPKARHPTQVETDRIQPYVDPNFGQLPEWNVDVKFVEWRYLPDDQKQTMIKERLMNGRTSEERNLIHKLLKIEHNLQHLHK